MPDLQVRETFKVTEPTRPDLLPITQYWHSDNVPEEVRATTASFQELNPGVPHRLFDERSAERLIDERFGPREVAAFRSCAVPAMQADYFRYCALSALAGFWVDVDFHCVAPLETMVEPGDGGIAFRPKEIDVPTNNCFLMFTAPNHPLPRLLLEVSTANIERRIGDTIPFVTGPWVLMMLGLIYRHGSVEAVEREMTDERFVRLARSIREAVGDVNRVVEAFDSVRIVPGRHLDGWIRRVGRHMAYKDSVDHWTNWQTEGRDIFRHPGQ